MNTVNFSSGPTFLNLGYQAVGIVRDQDGARHMIIGGPERRGQTGKCLHKYLMSERIMTRGESTKNLVICS